MELITMATRTERAALPEIQAVRRAKSRALACVEQHPTLFTTGFYTWLVSNFHIWQAFSSKADLLRQIGRTHYSARTIVESMRYDTDLADTDTDYKINGNWVPDMARLYNRLGACDFFSLRGRH